MQVGIGLDPLGRDDHAKTVAQVDHRADDGGHAVVAVKLGYEALVHLDLAERKAAQVAERPVARPEIVHRDPHAQHVEVMQKLEGLIGIRNQRRFGDLEFEPSRGKPGPSEHARHDAEQPVRPELRGRDVDRHDDVRGPGQGIGAGLKDRPFADLDQQSDFLGQADELLGQQLAAGRMVPADQRLERGDPSRPQVDLRLVEQPEFAPVKREPKAQFHVAPGKDPVLHPRFEPPRGAATGRLGPVEREVGVADKKMRRLPVPGRGRMADAGADDDVVAVDRIGGGQVRDQPVGQSLPRRRAGGRGDEHGEFVPAQPCDHGIGRHRVADPPRDLPQQAVADGMAQRIVHVLEPVEVDQKDIRRPVAAPVRQRGFDRLVEDRAVHKASQRVMCGQIPDPVVRLGLPGDVADNQDPTAAVDRLEPQHQDPTIAQSGGAFDAAAGRDLSFRIGEREVDGLDQPVKPADILGKRGSDAEVVPPQKAHVILVADDQGPVLVEHRQTTTHIVESDVELEMFLPQRLEHAAAFDLERLHLFDHEMRGAFGPCPFAFGLRIGRLHEVEQAVEVDGTIVAAAAGKLAFQDRMHAVTALRPEG